MGAELRRRIGLKRAPQDKRLTKLAYNMNHYARLVKKLKNDSIEAPLFEAGENRQIAVLARLEISPCPEVPLCHFHPFRFIHLGL
jgi:hypothetical protein